MYIEKHYFYPLQSVWNSVTSGTYATLANSKQATELTQQMKKDTTIFDTSWQNYLLQTWGEKKFSKCTSSYTTPAVPLGQIVESMPIQKIIYRNTLR